MKYKTRPSKCGRLSSSHIVVFGRTGEAQENENEEDYAGCGWCVLCELLHFALVCFGGVSVCVNGTGWRIDDSVNPKSQ